MSPELVRRRTALDVVLGIVLVIATVQVASIASGSSGRCLLASSAPDLPPSVGHAAGKACRCPGSPAAMSVPGEECRRPVTRGRLTRN